MIDLNIDLPEGFLDEEVRSGYTVTAERKKLWAVELDLWAQFDSVCRKHNLKYCVGAGTMLGAVRHHGFIPWDDDMDLYMLREDYDKLMQLADEFPEPYFLQNSRTEPKRLYLFARLRNSRTTGALSYEFDADPSVCKGIFIDIFPLDGISPDKAADAKQRKNNETARRRIWRFNSAKSSVERKTMIGKFKRVLRKTQVLLFYNDPKKLFRTYDNNLKKYSTPDAELVGNRTLVFDCPKSRRPVKDYTDLVYMPFEFVQVPVPRAYDSMLRQQYGNYMQIPEDKNGAVHGDILVSTDNTFDQLRRNRNI
ncbi:MAG: LicD family protein [Clostridia bacterium]|nr:LicD family protein [Clostridia bacterium]